MWNDIHNNANKLVQNKIVSSLINGKIEWEACHRGNRCNGYGQTGVARRHCITHHRRFFATGSYLRSRTRQDFHPARPPGTGKSQTITNIIANALYKGKRVLFVAGKRWLPSPLCKTGWQLLVLAPFCLEIHSNKTKKSAVISQLKKETTEIIRQTPPEEFRKEAERLLNLRAELNQYIEALHKEYPFGVSLYDAIIHYQSVDVESCFDIPQSLSGYIR